MTTFRPKICFHWTAGGYIPNAIDLKAYHFLVGPQGNVTKGVFAPKANFRNLQHARPETYAKHLGGGNSWTIGIALCGMSHMNADFTWDNPITQVQAEAAFKKAAELCHKHGIEISEESVFTHYEFGLKNPDSSSRGKIDITALPYEPQVKNNQIGDYIRTKVQWYLNKKKGGNRGRN
jgi:N-acetylmuramoyl-L-alanine amidase